MHCITFDIINSNSQIPWNWGSVVYGVQIATPDTIEEIISQGLDNNRGYLTKWYYSGLSANPRKITVTVPELIFVVEIFIRDGTKWTSPQDARKQHQTRWHRVRCELEFVPADRYPKLLPQGGVGYQQQICQFEELKSAVE